MTWAWRRRGGPFAPAMVVAVVGACGGGASDETASDGVEVRIECNLQKIGTCEDFDLDRIRARLSDAYEGEVDCEVGEVVFEGVAAGSYDVEVEGVDPDGLVIVDNRRHAHELTVDPAEATQLHEKVDVAVVAAQLWVRWEDVDDACAGESFAELRVRGYHHGGAYLLEQDTLGCDEPADDPDGYHLFEDPYAYLEGDELEAVAIQRYDDDGHRVGDEIEWWFDPPGHGRDLRLSLVCDAQACACAETSDSGDCLID